MRPRLDDDGPGSYDEILEYIETSILARMDVQPGQRKEKT